MTLTPSYRPDVVESFAARLEARARSVTTGWTAGGSLVGGALGAAPLAPLALPPTLGLGTVVGGLIVGGLAGRVIGKHRGEVHHLHAQTVLCQVHAQRATLAIWRLLRAQQVTDERGHASNDETAIPTTAVPEPETVVEPALTVAATPNEPPPTAAPQPDTVAEPALTVAAPPTEPPLSAAPQPDTVAEPALTVAA